MREIYKIYFLLALLFVTTWHINAQTLNIEGGTLNIGPILTGTTSPDGAHSFTITGSGFNPYELVYIDSPTNLFKLSLTGTSGSYTTSEFFTTDLTGNVNQTVYVNYSPQVAGPVPTNLSIYEFQTFTFYDKAVQGVGKAPEILLEGRPSLADVYQEIVDGDTTTASFQGTDFGETAYAVDITERTYRITNNLPPGGLNGDLLLSEYAASKFILISGTNADQFSVVLEPAALVTTNYDTTIFTIQFEPLNYGVKKATVTIGNNDPDENPYTFAIQGMGVIEMAGIPIAKKPSFVDNNNFYANWKPGAGGTPTGYLLDVATDELFLDLLPGYESLDVGNVTTKNITGLDAATIYYYRVRAYKPGSTSNYSNVMTVLTAPHVPTILPATVVGINDFFANWSFITGATGYRLDVNTSPDFDGISFISDGKATLNYLYVDNLTGGVTYYYRVRSYNGNASENSAVISVATFPEKPTAINATQVIDEGFTANWSFSNPVFVEGFILDIATDPGFNNFVPGYQNHNVGPFLQEYVTGLDTTTTYYYRVRTRYVNDTTEYSNTIAVTTTANSPQVEVSIKVMLEGAFGTGQMTTALNSAGVIPLDQPYTLAPFNYNGSESVISLPSSNVVDWILMDLLKQSPTDTSVFYLLGRKAAFLMNNGQIVGLDGIENPVYKTASSGDYFIRILHRNHLPVLSANPLMEQDGVYVYDFTASGFKTFAGQSGQKQLSTELWGMIAADGDGSEEINTNDINDIWYQHLNENGYFRGDFDMNGQVNLIDKINLWKINVGKGISNNVYSVIDY